MPLRPLSGAIFGISRLSGWVLAAATWPRGAACVGWGGTERGTWLTRAMRAREGYLREGYLVDQTERGPERERYLVDQGDAGPVVAYDDAVGRLQLPGDQLYLQRRVLF